MSRIGFDVTELENFEVALKIFVCHTGVDPRYQCKFWYGETHKAHFTLDILRTIPLGMAIYIAVLLLVYLPQLFEDQVFNRAAQESEIPNFKGSYLGRFPLVSADFWTSDHLSERSRSVDAFFGTRARGKLTLKRR